MRRIEPATRRDLAAITALLTTAELPTHDLAEHFPVEYVVAREGAGLVGCAGLEPHGRAALLRSIAVAPRLRGSGLGRALLEERIAAARAGGVETVYLLTTSAAAFFRRFAFVDASRDEAAQALTGSLQLGDCCATAACLARRL
jgi:amino-acid N-acetyltransferase